MISLPENGYESLLSELGGEAVLRDVVRRFHERVLADPRICGFFRNVDIERLERHQTRFLCYAFESERCPGPSLQAIHRRLVSSLGLSEIHLEAMIECLSDAFLDRDIHVQLIARAIAIVRQLQSEVLGLPRYSGPA